MPVGSSSDVPLNVVIHVLILALKECIQTWEGAALCDSVDGVNLQEDLRRYFKCSISKPKRAVLEPLQTVMCSENNYPFCDPHA